MKKHNQIAGVFIICFLAIAQLSLKSKINMYTYIDGNNNVFSIAPESLSYEPISKEQSSSGEYDGGEPKMVKITNEQFTKIEGIIDAILADKSIHEKNREMGFGTIIVGKKTIYINRNADKKTALETELKMCLK